MGTGPVSLGGHKGKVVCVAFSPDAKTLASADLDGTIVLWAVPALLKQTLIQDRTSVFSVAFSPDGKRLATGGTDFPDENKPVGVVKMWDAASGRELSKFRGEVLSNPIFSVAFSPEGRILAAAGPDTLRAFKGGDCGQTQLWDVTTGQVAAVFRMHLDPVGALAFSSDGKTLAMASGTPNGLERTAEVQLWDLSTSRAIVTIKRDRAIRTVAFSPDGRRLAMGGGRYPDILEGETQVVTELKVWEVATGQEIMSLLGNVDPVYSVCFSPDGRFLASGGGRIGEKRAELRLWDTFRGSQLTVLKGHKDLITSVAISGNGRWLASGSFDKTVRLWDAVPLLRPAIDRVHGGAGLESDALAKTSLGHDANLEVLWSDLSSPDAARAYRAVWCLVDQPRRAVPFLAERLRQPPEEHLRQIDQLIADMDSNSFAKRGEAMKQLEKLGASVAPALRQVRVTGSPEVRRRANELLEHVPLPSAEPLRTIRAMGVLENADSPEALQLLQKLARGPRRTWVTEEARESLERITKRRNLGP